MSSTGRQWINSRKAAIEKHTLRDAAPTAMFCVAVALLEVADAIRESFSSPKNSNGKED